MQRVVFPPYLKDFLKKRGFFKLACAASFFSRILKVSNSPVQVPPFAENLVSCDSWKLLEYPLAWIELPCLYTTIHRAMDFRSISKKDIRTTFNVLQKWLKCEYEMAIKWFPTKLSFGNRVKCVNDNLIICSILEVRGYYDSSLIYASVIHKHLL